ncbi:hypothetical protein OF83DRAFT_1173300 [Amylostereum chailletii]|nr:hypothetical protein OF83DRAFT_1173300 [Amylostereum chailletii]
MASRELTWVGSHATMRRLNALENSGPAGRSAGNVEGARRLSAFGCHGGFGVAPCSSRELKLEVRRTESGGEGRVPLSSLAPQREPTLHAMRFQTVIALAALLASFSNLAYIASHIDRAFFKGAKDPAYSYHGHDFPETLPLPDGDLPPVQLTVEESVHYPAIGISADEEWAALTAAGYHYVRLGPDDRLFIVTMFHELHCLRILNLAFSKTPPATRGHLKHCLDYLRQGALCAADVTLEPGDFEQRDFEVERVGATHTCRDWSAVYPVMDANYYAWRDRTAT